MSARPPSYMEQAIARSLSPRRRAQPNGLQGNSYTHYNGYAMPVNYLSALDLQAPNFSYATGHQYPIANYSVYGPPPRESRPMHKHKSRRSSDKDYVHNHSMFTSTIPQVTGYYIIHPDWVSERASLRRTNSMMALQS